MDDTKLTPRQAKILDVLSQTPVTGVKIAEKTKDFLSDVEGNTNEGACLS